jgi:hypothetical protein
MKTNIHFLKSYFAQFFLEYKMMQTVDVEKIKKKTHLMFHNFFVFENRAVYEIM